MKMIEYLAKMKKFVDGLAIAGALISDDDLISKMVWIMSICLLLLFFDDCWILIGKNFRQRFSALKVR
ncbi:hypothetical protein Sjap_013790 [Stephania japonica]|uniref:Uncharacterized protein n=1 Tax=Stephania japonica TaxID=461633 RepID=A0AAP0J0E0_9MAGN